MHLFKFAATSVVAGPTGVPDSHPLPWISRSRHQTRTRQSPVRNGEKGGSVARLEMHDQASHHVVCLSRSCCKICPSPAEVLLQQAMTKGLLYPQAPTILAPAGGGVGANAPRMTTSHWPPARPQHQTMLRMQHLLQGTPAHHGWLTRRHESRRYRYCLRQLGRFRGS